MNWLQEAIYLTQDKLPALAPTVSVRLKKALRRLIADRIQLSLKLRMRQPCNLSATLGKRDIPIRFISKLPSEVEKQKGFIRCEIALDFPKPSTDEAVRIYYRLPGKSKRRLAWTIKERSLRSIPSASPLEYSIDGILKAQEDEKQKQILYGWCFALDPLELNGIRARLDEDILNLETHLERSDVTQAYPGETNAKLCGFEIEIPEGKPDGALSLEAQIGDAPWTVFFQKNLGALPVSDAQGPATIETSAQREVHPAKFNVDTLFKETRTKLITRMLGWVVLDPGPAICGIRMRYRDKVIEGRYGLQRQDVQGLLPDNSHAGDCGFEFDFDRIDGNPMLHFEYRTEEDDWTEFDRRKVSQIKVTPYTDAVIDEQISGVRASVENAQVGRRFGHEFLIQGWCFTLDGKDIDKIRIKSGKQSFEGKWGVPRKDVFKENGDKYSHSLKSGFEIPLDKIARNALLKFEYRKAGSRKWTLFAEEDFSKYPVSHFATQSEENHNYRKWLKEYGDRIHISNEDAPDRIAKLSAKPRISIVMPVYNPPLEFLKEAVKSVQNQQYENWELCIADDASTKEEIRPYLESVASEDERIHCVFREENGHISHASNSALELATGQYTTLLDHDDQLPVDALLRLAEAISDNPEALVFYSDEDKINEDGERFDPYFKPDWNPFLLEGQNYFCHLTCLDTQLMRRVGGFTPGTEGSQDWDLFLRATDAVEDQQIIHIPYILYHWRAIQGSTALDLLEKDYIRKSSLKALESHVERKKLPAKVVPAPHGHWRLKLSAPAKQPSVALIIPTRDQVELLRNCITSIRNLTTYQNYQIVVVDNGSEQQDTLDYFKELQADGQKVLHYDKPFNYSAINNFAVKHCKSDLIAFVNNDITAIHADWLEEMVCQALRPGVGAVGAKLYFPEDCLQHGGIVLGINGVAGHCFKYSARGEPGQRNRLNLVQQYCAVTAACMLLRRSIFEEVKGFNDQELAVAFNDVDLCLRIEEAGYRNVWTPNAYLYHHESLSRGDDNRKEKKQRVVSEIDYMKQRWGSLLRNDPTYNPNLTLEFEDFSLAWPPRVKP